MTAAELRKVQLLQLQMAKEVKRICEKHQIKYFLDAGSMLGAVRHHGFIPWDDDLDIGFLRDEYDKFLEVAPKELGSQYYIQNSSMDDNYGLAFSKIRLKGTKFVENMSQQNAAAKEIYIDLFPYDNRNNDEKSAQREAFQFRILTHLFMIKCRMYVWKGQGFKKWLKFLPFQFLALFYSKTSLRSKIEEIVSLHKDETCERVFERDGTVAYFWHMPKQILEKQIMMKFEDEEFPVPEDYDSFLSRAYGDYMTLPPEEKRKTHNIIELDFGVYK